MVEQKILEIFDRIFDMKRTTFNAPNEEAVEQETLFLRIESARPSIKEGKEIYRIAGQGFFFAKASRFPIGFLSKRINQAANADTKDLFFYELEENLPVYQDLVRKSFAFVYFFSGDYDPDHGRITSIEYTEGGT